MGLFSREKTPQAPNRSKREKCWESRDIFFKCLDRIDVVNPLDKNVQGKIKKNCSKEDAQFQKDCVASWVKHFKEKRPFDIKKEQILREAAEQQANAQIDK
ncbi:hypothetical protein KL930_001746 [Ogataea haglerorum]|uniref:Cytochrome c oxidase assembly factor 6 n=1 Tax=Ogataea haglerorum TaxID=1937702 RepID=A0AAN6I1W7_9ASCO|nr:uncharacterized protein KL911_001687 [Ogataea haglerorum]KAG7698084.1 hypothetical protein KL915_001801 [Ogataea haglerorum]KAG7699622.1 hypothetical protein KL951_001339 [Ogataea haglerorum]KAG7708306.1 hypothetical protein KL914_002032 [Ogataea haglerorum]KAG7710667.1 hypothetical protein KL950_001580 [Ogataea haglerorum]KAG7721288.1 hypothetical protein KL913_001024 [Ogataea haglerorum]